MCGAIGFFLRRHQWPLPLLLAFILGPLEKYLIQSLSMSGGSP